MSLADQTAAHAALPHRACVTGPRENIAHDVLKAAGIPRPRLGAYERDVANAARRRDFGIPGSSFPVAWERDPAQSLAMFARTDVREMYREIVGRRPRKSLSDEDVLTRVWLVNAALADAGARLAL